MIKSFFKSFTCCFSSQQDVVIENNPEVDETTKMNRDTFLEREHYSAIEADKDKKDKGKSETLENVLAKKKIRIDSSNKEYEKILIDDKYIREDERPFITFSKNGILKFIEKLHEIDDYSVIYDKNDFKLQGRKGSPFNKKLELSKQIFKAKKSDFKNGVDVKLLRNLIFDYPTRKKWDTTVKDIRKIEGNDEVYIVQNISASPVFFISERDTIDKRFEFVHDDIFYNFTTSIDDGIVPLEKGVVRCKYYLAVNIFEISGDDVTITVYSQFDGKAMLPQSFLNLTLPYILDTWYHDLVKSANRTDL